MIEIFVFLTGLCIGSFLNVCIHRWPDEKSVIKPGSHCPKCKHPIAWQDNIPLLSFVLLKAKCRYCGEKISPRYFAVELLTGLLWLLLWFRFGPTVTFTASLIYFSILFAVTITDLETGYIPDGFTFTGMAAGLVLSTIHPSMHGETVWYLGLLKSLLGLFGGGGFLFLVGWVGNIIFRKESMGGGDIKLLAMIGAFLGVGEAALVFLLSPVLALPIALYAKFVKKAETIPFGPYIAAMGAIFFFFGDGIAKKFYFY